MPYEISFTLLLRITFNSCTMFVCLVLRMVIQNSECKDALFVLMRIFQTFVLILNRNSFFFFLIMPYKIPFILLLRIISILALCFFA
jgi:hypothetical protein